MLGTIRLEVRYTCPVRVVGLLSDGKLAVKYFHHSEAYNFRHGDQSYGMAVDFRRSVLDLEAACTRWLPVWALHACFECLLNVRRMSED